MLLVASEYRPMSFLVIRNSKLAWAEALGTSTCCTFALTADNYFLHNSQAAP